MELPPLPPPPHTHTNKGSLVSKAPQFEKCLLGLHILCYGPDEVKMSNLGVSLGWLRWLGLIRLDGLVRLG